MRREVTVECIGYIVAFLWPICSVTRSAIIPYRTNYQQPTINDNSGFMWQKYHLNKTWSLAVILIILVCVQYAGCLQSKTTMLSGHIKNQIDMHNVTDTIISSHIILFTSLVSSGESYVLVITHFISGESCVLMITHAIFGESYALMITYVISGESYVLMITHVISGESYVLMITLVIYGESYVLMIKWDSCVAK